MLYHRLARDPYGTRMPWEQTFVFWGDERWGSPDHRDSNQRMAKAELLDRVPIPPANAKPIVTVGVEPAVSATAAERHACSRFKRDVRP